MNVADFGNVEPLDSETWAYLNDEGKIKALQTLENELAASQNRAPGTVRIEQLPPHCGAFQAGNDITLNKLYTDPPDNARHCVGLVAHESRHIQQDAWRADPASQPGISGATANMIRYNYETGYVSPNQNAELYWNQPLETDARRYADLVQQDYDKHYANQKDKALNAPSAPAAGDDWQSKYLQGIADIDQRKAVALTAEELAEQQSKKKSTGLGL